MNLVKGRYYKLRFAAENGEYSVIGKYRGSTKYGKLVFENGEMEYLISKEKFLSVCDQSKDKNTFSSF